MKKIVIFIVFCIMLAISACKEKAVETAKEREFSTVDSANITLKVNKKNSEVEKEGDKDNYRIPTFDTPPLAQSETLDYSYNQNENILTVYKINGGNKQIYCENKEALWGGYQIAEDKKTMIFWKNIFERSMPLYYADGTIGEIKYISKIPLNARMDKKGNYLIYEDVHNSGVFKIIDLKTGKFLHEIIWDISNKSSWTSTGAGFDILRAAENKEYDFMILFSIENLLIAKAFVDLSVFSISTDFDDSNLFETQLRKSENFGSEFTGWY